MLYVYAITEPAPSLDDLVGVRRTIPRGLGDRRIGVVVSDLEAKLSELNEEDMWAHETVVEALMDRGPVLPMRLGTVLPDEDAVGELVRARGEELSEGLRRVQGAVELGVRAVIEAEQGEGAAATAAPGEAETGSAYLLGKLAAEQHREEITRRIHDPLAALSRESAIRVRRSRKAQLQGAYLVDRSGVETFRARVEQLERDRVASALVCTGPWPPYSFTGARSAR